MAKVTLIFEDTPEGLEFTEDFASDVAPGSELLESPALVVGAFVSKMVEELLGPELEESGS